MLRQAYAVATSGSGKHERSEAFEKIVEEYKAQFSEEELTDENWNDRSRTITM